MNHVTLIGRLARDPRVTNGDNTRAFFTLAIDRRGSAGGTDWIGVTVFGSQAEAVASYVGKGHLVSVEGYLRTSTWERDGETVYGLEVIGNRVEFLARPRGATSEQPGHEDPVEGEAVYDPEPF